MPLRSVNPWNGSLMMSRSSKSLLRNISTSSAVLGPPMFSIKTPVLAPPEPAVAAAVVASCLCRNCPKWMICRRGEVRVAADAIVDERAEIVKLMLTDKHNIKLLGFWGQ